MRIALNKRKQKLSATLLLREILGYALGHWLVSERKFHNSRATFADLELQGGALERPAQKYSAVFGKIRFFHDFPYALPNIVTSAIALTAAIITALFVKEVRIAVQHLSQS